MPDRTSLSISRSTAACMPESELAIARAATGVAVADAIAELLLDAQQLVVFGDAVAAAGRAGLDLPRRRADGQVRDRAVLGLAGAVRDDRGVAGVARHRDRVERLRHGADLIQLHEQRVADAFGDALRAGSPGWSRTRRRPRAAPGRRARASAPSTRPSRSSATPSSIEMIGYCRTQSAYISTISRGGARRLARLLEDVRAVVPQLARRDVEREEHVAARPSSPALPTASSTTSSASRFDFRFGAKPPSSPTPVEWPAFFRIAAQRVEDLGAGAQRLGERRQADRHHHELLEVDAAVGVRAAVQDVHHRHRQQVRAVGRRAPLRCARCA